jgi:hypothetical protein
MPAAHSGMQVPCRSLRWRYDRIDFRRNRNRLIGFENPRGPGEVPEGYRAFVPQKIVRIGYDPKRILIRRRLINLLSRLLLLSRHIGR